MDAFRAQALEVVSLAVSWGDVLVSALFYVAAALLALAASLGLYLVPLGWSARERTSDVQLLQ